MKLVFLMKPMPAQRKGRVDVGDVEWYATCIILPLEREKEIEGWKRLYVGGIDGISCQHLQVLMTQLLQKHWE